MTTHKIPPSLGWEDVYIITTRDGSNTLFSRMYNATYHSVYGAVAESKHVFIQHGLKTLLDRPAINILEFGFGTGLNAFLAYLLALNHEKEITYTGIEAYPIDTAVARKLDYPYYLAFPEEGDIYLRMHEEDSFSAGPFTFLKIASPAGINVNERYDCIFFDAFAPGTQPDLWDQSIFETLYSLTAEGGCLVTYCAQGEVRRRLVSAGFEVSRIDGPPGKREMLRGIKKPEPGADQILS